MNKQVPMSEMKGNPIARITAICHEHMQLEGPLLPILHAVNREFGHVPEEALPVIARQLNLSRAEVYGVLSFYRDFRRSRPGHLVLRICCSEACQAMGGDELAEQAKRRLGIDWSETTDDDRVTIEPVFCLGLCSCAPAVMVDDKPVGHVTQKRLDQILNKAAE